MTDLFDKCTAFNRDIEAMSTGFYPFFRAISRMDGPHVIVDGRELIMVGSNNYLGLTTHPKVRQAAMRALKEYGTSCSGSRFLNGTLELHEQLEASLARFVGKQAALIFSTGFQTSQGVIAPLVGRSDTVIMDRLVHASTVEGTRLGFGKVRRFLHSDVDSLRSYLEVSTDGTGILVVVDGVYSMDGDIAPLPEIIATAKEFGARIMVDDAHGIGVLGKEGRGTQEHFGLNDEIDIVIGTFSKSLASLGGFVAGDARVVSYIKHHSRALIFAAAMPPSSVAAVQAALDVIQTEPDTLERLWRNTRFLTEGMLDLGFDIGPTQTPIVPLIVGDDARAAILWKRLFDEGLYTNCVVAPGVPRGQQRIRMCAMATHSEEDLKRTVEICAQVGKELGLIK